MPTTETRDYVRDLQRAVTDHSQSQDDLRSALARASERLRGVGGGAVSSLEWDVQSDVPEGRFAVRTRRPTPALITIGVPEEATEDVDHVELYQTALNSEGTSETRLVGVSRYPDSDGRWRIEYSSSRVIPREDGNLVLHAEVLGRERRLLAIDAVGLVD